MNGVLVWRKINFGQSISPAGNRRNKCVQDFLKRFSVQGRQQSFWKFFTLSNVLDLGWCLSNKWKHHSSLYSPCVKDGELSKQAAAGWIFNNYLPKWRWIAVDIYRAAKLLGGEQYLANSPPLWCIIFKYDDELSTNYNVQSLYSPLEIILKEHINYIRSTPCYWGTKYFILLPKHKVKLPSCLYLYSVQWTSEQGQYVFGNLYCKKTSIVDNAVLDCAWKSLVKIDLYAQLKGQITFKIKLGLELETFRAGLFKARLS